MPDIVPLKGVNNAVADRCGVGLYYILKGTDKIFPERGQHKHIDRFRTLAEMYLVSQYSANLWFFPQNLALETITLNSFEDALMTRIGASIWGLASYYIYDGLRSAIVKPYCKLRSKSEDDLNIPEKLSFLRVRP